MPATGTPRNPEWPIRPALPRSATYAERAKECRQLAEIGTGYWTERYLELAAEYEQLAKEAEWETRRRLD
jgi:hypothetical protein